MNGTLVPIDGGNPIPLVKERIVIGRNPDCDIRIGFPNVSGKHCELFFSGGNWLVRDLASTNGVKVNGIKVDKKRLTPGDELTIARKHHYRIEFNPEGYGGFHEEEEPEVAPAQEENILAKPLLERAGLQRPSKPIEFDSDIFEDEDEPTPRKAGRDKSTDRKRWTLDE